MIRFDRLCAGYDGTETLHDITLALPEGKLTALIGPNGCGKSTLLKVAAGILKPMSGEARIGGQSVPGMSPRSLAKIAAYMPQSRPAPEMTVGQLAAHGRYPYLKWGRDLSAADRDIVRCAMERAGIAELAGKRIDRISGGERQRAYLAMMLAQKTPVMLLDEPDTYLDLRARFDMAGLLKALAGEGRTILAVMHDLSLALGYCDNIVLMNEGRVVISGAPETVFASGLIDNAFDIRVSRTGSEGGAPDGYIFTPRSKI